MRVSQFFSIAIVWTILFFWIGMSFGVSSGAFCPFFVERLILYSVGLPFYFSIFLGLLPTYATQGVVGLFISVALSMVLVAAVWKMINRFLKSRLKSAAVIVMALVGAASLTTVVEFWGESRNIIKKFHFQDEFHYVASEGHTIYYVAEKSIGAFDTGAGVSLWSHRLPDMDDGRYNKKAIPSKDAAYFLVGRREVSEWVPDKSRNIVTSPRRQQCLKYDKKTGSLLWKSEFQMAGKKTALLYDGSVVIVGSDSIICFDAASGKEIWSIAAVDQYTNDVEMVKRGGGLLFVLKENTRLFAVDEVAGKILWEIPAKTTVSTDGRTVKSKFPAISVVGDKIYLARDEDILKLDIKTGKELGTAHYPVLKMKAYSHSWRKLVIADQVIYAFQEDGRVAKFSTYSGEKFWESVISKARLRGYDSAITPIVIGDHILIGGGYWGGGFALIAYNAFTGSRAWTVSDYYTYKIHETAIEPDRLYATDGKELAVFAFPKKN